MEDNKIYVTTEDGKELEYTVLFTFNLEEFDKDYVVYFEEGDDELFVSSFTSEDDDSGSLGVIENDEEWEKIEEVIEKYLEDDEQAE